MNILAAASYLKIGYRIRRSLWAIDSYLKTDWWGDCEFYYRYKYFTIGKVDGITQTIEHSYIGGGTYNLNVKDLLADDWEIITTGIRKHHNKYGLIEYDDDTDWDNYTSSPSDYWDE